jgi:hypothetical protein
VASQQQDILRHCSQTVRESDNIRHPHEMLEAVYQDEYRTIVDEFEDLRDFEQSGGQDVTLLRRMGEIVQLDHWNEKWVIFHYRSMLNDLQTSAGYAVGVIRGSGNYLLAVSLVVIVLVTLNEAVIQPDLVDVYASFGAEPPRQNHAACHALACARREYGACRGSGRGTRDRVHSCALCGE